MSGDELCSELNFQGNESYPLLVLCPKLVKSWLSRKIGLPPLKNWEEFRNILEKLKNTLNGSLVKFF